MGGVIMLIRRKGDNMTEEWELRLNHERDVRNAQIESRNEAFGEKLEIPEDPSGGLKVIKDLWRRFSGKSFWKKFESLGHSSMEFGQCNCNHNAVKQAAFLTR